MDRGCRGSGYSDLGSGFAAAGQPRKSSGRDSTEWDSVERFAEAAGRKFKRLKGVTSNAIQNRIKSAQYTPDGEIKIFHLLGKERISLKNDEQIFLQIDDEEKQDIIDRYTKWKSFKNYKNGMDKRIIDIPLEEDPQNPMILRVLRNNQYSEKDGRMTFEPLDATYFKRWEKVR